jgi:PKD repeat protein
MPHAVFSYEDATSSNVGQIIFIDNSYDGNGDITNWTWDFGDQSKSYKQNPVHHYTRNGSYLVNLTVRDNDGNSNTCSQIITIRISTSKITSLSVGWNFISIPFNNSIPRNMLVVEKDGGFYNWSQASSDNNPHGSSIIDRNTFGWQREEQISTSSTMINPGFGYWLYCYMNATLSTIQSPQEASKMITMVKEKWNIIGIPYDVPIDKNDIEINGIIWEDAYSFGVIDNHIFGWNRYTQRYYSADILLPGEAYWLYTYQPGILDRTN